MDLTWCWKLGLYRNIFLAEKLKFFGLKFKFERRKKSFLKSRIFTIAQDPDRVRCVIQIKISVVNGFGLPFFDESLISQKNKKKWRRSLWKLKTLIKKKKITLMFRFIFVNNIPPNCATSSLTEKFARVQKKLAANLAYL